MHKLMVVMLAKSVHKQLAKPLNGNMFKVIQHNKLLTAGVYALKVQDKNGRKFGAFESETCLIVATGIRLWASKIEGGDALIDVWKSIDRESSLREIRLACIDSLPIIQQLANDESSTIIVQSIVLQLKLLRAFEAPMIISGNSTPTNDPSDYSALPCLGTTLA